MAVEEIVDVSAFIVSALGKIGLWLQAIGILVVLWIIFQIVSTVYNMKRMKEIKVIKEDMSRIEGKIDKILGKRNN